MELFNALRSSNICNTEELSKLIIKLQLSDGMRNENAFSARFFVSKPDGAKLCSVKKIPENGIFNIDHIMCTQKIFRNLEVLSAPEIIGVYHGEDGYVYIIEEYLEGQDTLFESIEQKQYTIKQSIEVLNKLFNSIKLQPSMPFDLEIINEEIQLFYNALELVGLSDQLLLDIKKKLAVLVNKNINSLTTELLWTNGDLLTRNIIIEGNQPFLTDFDLSRKTHFFWLDIYRCSHYSNVPIEELNVNINVDGQLLKLLFHLNEIVLQQRVLNTSAYLDSSISHKQKVLELINITLGIQIEPVVIDESTSNALISDGDAYIQLFWPLDNEYSEGNSKKTKIIEDGEFHKYNIEIPSGDIIRFDPSNKQGQLEIISIIVSNSLLEKIEISKETNFKELAIISGLLQLDHVELLNVVSLSNDPQILINLSNLERNNNSKVSITIEMRYIPNISNLVIDNFLIKSNELVKTQHELNELNAVYNEVKDNFKVVTKQLQESADWLQKLELSVSEGNINIVSLKNDLENSRNSELAKASSLLEMENELSIIKNTISWRITRPLRIIRKYTPIGKKIGRVIKILINKKYTLNLIPVSDLAFDSGEHQWKSTGNDPHFFLEGKFITNWVKIVWTSFSEDNLPLKLYWDNGNGYSESQNHIIGHIKKGEKSVQEALVYISPLAKRLRIDVGEKESSFMLGPVYLYQISRFHVLTKSAIRYIKQRGLTARTIKSLLVKTWDIYKVQGPKGVWAKMKYSINGTNTTTNSIDYQTWITNRALTEKRKMEITKEITSFTYAPLISIILPVYNVEEIWLVKCIESVRDQLYTNWELCIADDASPKPHIREVLTRYAEMDERIKVVFREKNGHISEASNSALAIANGEFVALLDHDDELSIDALYENVKVLNENSDIDMIYSDEDKISPEGERHSPFFKPDWSPDTFLSQMYTCHLGVYRTSLIREIGGFRKGFEGSQDYDLVLRFTEKTNRIYHIPQILYHWRSIPQSTASGGAAKSYTNDAGYRALQEALDRRHISGWIEPDPEASNLYVLHYKLSRNPLISIIIPTRNMTTILETCITSIFDKTIYRNFEIIVVDNGSDDPTTIELFQKWLLIEPIRFRVERIDIPFNYSRLNNLAVDKANGELILLLNNDIEVITPTWLEEMAAQAIRPEIGAVGACLLYPDNTIQHAGIILGIGGIAGHSHKYFDSKDYGYFSRLRMVTNYSAVTAACLMIRKEVYLSISGLDEDLEVAFNDVDFCMRVGKTGLRNVWLPQVKLYHHESKSRGQEDTPAKIARFNKEIEYVQARWGRCLLEDPYYNKNLTLDHEDFSLSMGSK